MASQAGDTARERSAPITMRAAARMMEEHDVATTSARNKRLKSDFLIAASRGRSSRMNEECARRLQQPFAWDVMPPRSERLQNASATGGPHRSSQTDSQAGSQSSID